VLSNSTQMSRSARLQHLPAGSQGTASWKHTTQDKPGPTKVEAIFCHSSTSLLCSCLFAHFPHFMTSCSFSHLHIFLPLSVVAFAHFTSFFLACAFSTSFLAHIFFPHLLVVFLFFLCTCSPFLLSTDFYYSYRPHLRKPSRIHARSVINDVYTSG